MSSSNCIALSMGIDDIVPSKLPRRGPHAASRDSDDAAARARCIELETDNLRLGAEVDAVRTELAACRKQGDTALFRCVAEIERQAGEQVVELAVRCADVLLRDALPHADMIRNIVRDVVPAALSLSSIRIHLSPADAAILRGDEELSGSSYELVSDPSLGVGDVMVRTANGTFDARVDERLKLLREELNERRMSLYAECDAA
jgi:hypothetical protein